MRQKYISALAVIFGGTIPFLSATGAINSALHYAVTESKNTATGMVTSIIQKTKSSEQCERQRKEAKKAYMSVELFDVFHSVCLSELPLRLSHAADGAERWTVVINYVDDGIDTTAIFYEVDHSWTDTTACLNMTERYKRIDPNVKCKSYLDERGNYYLDKYGSGIGPPSAESVKKEELQPAETDVSDDPFADIGPADPKYEWKGLEDNPFLTSEDSEDIAAPAEEFVTNRQWRGMEPGKNPFVKESETADTKEKDKYWTLITKSEKDCRTKNPGLVFQACWERVLPEKCAMLVYQTATSSSTYFAPLYACAQSCNDAGFYSRNFGECRREYRID